METRDSIKDHLYLLVLCGGGGTRLWPRSRNAHPKQFAKLLGKETLLQMTIGRFRGFLPFERIFVVTTSGDYGRLVKKQIPQMPKKNIIIEPARRDTAMAHALGALYIERIDPEAVVLTEAADRPITDVKAYLNNFLLSAEFASEGDYLVTTGVKPEFPHTGLGYVKRGKLAKEIDGKKVFKVEKFTEKPDLKTAQKYQKDKDYFWHTGFYVWKASSYLKALAKYAPELGEAVDKIKKVLGSFREKKVLKEVYESVPKIAVDYAVSEKADNFYMVVGNFGWDDVGDWKNVYDLVKKDKNGNAVLKFGADKGEFIGIDSKNNLVQFDDQLIALVGVEDLVVVDAGDIVLVCRKDKAQEVKKMVNYLKEKKREEYL